MKYYLVVGEASGDLHASNLMQSLRELDRDAVFSFFGGDLMQSKGGTLVKHYREMAYMGTYPGHIACTDYPAQPGFLQKRYCSV